MNILTKTKMGLFLIVIPVIGLLCTCAGPAPASEPPPPGESSGSSTVTPPTEEPLGPPDRVDVVYFHRPQRCKTCICFEERISYVVNTYFQEELASGKLTFEILNLGDEENALIASKYCAISSQLFINTVSEGVDHIEDIQEIWDWGCTKNEEGFDEAVRTTIEQSLNGEA